MTTGPEAHLTQGLEPRHQTSMHKELILCAASLSIYEVPRSAADLADARNVVADVVQTNDGPRTVDGIALDPDVVDRARSAVDPEKWILGEDVRATLLRGAEASSKAELLAVPGMKEEYDAYKKHLKATGQMGPEAFSGFRHTLAALVGLSDDLLTAKASQKAASPGEESQPETTSTTDFIMPNPKTMARPKAKTVEEAQPKPEAAKPEEKKGATKAPKKVKEASPKPAVEPSEAAAPKQTPAPAESKPAETKQSQTPEEKKAKLSPAKTRSSKKPANVSHKRDGIADILEDGKKAGGAYVDATGRVRYGGNAVDVIRDDARKALFADEGKVRTKRLGRRFMSAAELNLIEAHAEQIRDGLSDRDKPGEQPIAQSAGDASATSTTAEAAKPQNEDDVQADLGALAASGAVGISAAALEEALAALGFPTANSGGESTPPVAPAQQTAEQNPPATPPTAPAAPATPAPAARPDQAPDTSRESLRKRTKRRLVALGTAALMVMGIGLGAHQVFESSNPADSGTQSDLFEQPDGNGSTESTLFETPDSSTEAPGATDTLTKGENPWTVSRDYLHQLGVKNPTNAQVWQLDQMVLRLNGISMAQARHLPVGQQLVLPSSDWVKRSLGV